MPELDISKELLNRGKGIPGQDNPVICSTLLNVAALPDDEQEAVRLPNLVLEAYRLGDALKAYKSKHVREYERLDGILDAIDGYICDSLTPVYSRKYFEEMADSLILTLSRAKGTLGLMMVSIDCFQQYNGSFGNFDGDECLRIVAEVLQECTVQKEDCVARYGGSKFVVILPNTDKTGACKVAEKMICGVLERNLPHPKNAAADYVTISVGIVGGQVRQTHTRDDFLKLANEMLCQSKQDGRNRYTYTDL